MAYQPLARKYRPQTFADLMGQASVATALTNAIRLNKEPHAVIFAGIRGVGKTTTARLYAKALNCDRGPTPEPCGQCESCMAIESGQHPDVLEIDGASNTGVDDVRALRETIQYIPQRSKFRVFIVDEVHMLSQNAFNALLKTLEEPPAHAVFVFATTELQKIPKTIMSRCQLFQLKQFSTADIVSRLAVILDREGISAEAGALNWIAREGRGSMRDALTCLDQVIALGDGTVSMQAMASVLGFIEHNVFIDCLAALIKREAQQFLVIVEQLASAGVVFSSIIEELAKYCRDAGLLNNKIDPRQIAHAEYEDSLFESLQRLAAAGALLDWQRIFRWLMKCREDLDGSFMDRYIFENYGLEWCLDPGLPSVDALLRGAAVAVPVSSEATSRGQSSVTPPTATPNQSREKLANLRQQLRQEPAMPAQPVKEPVVNTAPDITPIQSQGATAKEFPPTWRELVERWKQLKPMQARILEEVYLIAYGPQLIGLAVSPDSLAAAKLLQPTIRSKFRDAFSELFGFSGDLQVQIREVGETANTQQATMEAPSSAPRTILQDKVVEKDDEKRRLIESAKNHPLTLDMVRTLGATVKDIVVE